MRLGFTHRTTYNSGQISPVGASIPWGFHIQMNCHELPWAKFAHTALNCPFQGNECFYVSEALMLASTATYPIYATFWGKGEN